MITLESLKGKSFHQFPHEVRELISDVRMKFGPRDGDALQAVLEGQYMHIHDLRREAIDFAIEHGSFLGIDLKFPEHRFVA